MNVRYFWDLAYKGDSLVVIGTFFSVSGRNANRAAVLTDAGWERMEGIPHLSPRKIFTASGEFYVGMGRVAQTPSYVYVWNGTAFNGLPAPSYAEAGMIIGGAELNGTVYAVFDYAFLNDGLLTPGFILAYNNRQQIPIVQPDKPSLRGYASTGVFALDGALFVTMLRLPSADTLAFDTTMVRFDGSTWEVANVQPTRRRILSPVVWRGNAYAIMDDPDPPPGTTATSLVRWTGSQWIDERYTGNEYLGLWPTPNGLILSSREIGTNTTLLERYNGAIWEELTRFTGTYLPRKVSSRAAWQSRRL